MSGPSRARHRGVPQTHHPGARQFEPYCERRNSCPEKEKAVRLSRRTALFEEKSGRQDLNLRPLDPQSSTLAKLRHAPNLLSSSRPIWGDRDDLCMLAAWGEIVKPWRLGKRWRPHSQAFGQDRPARGLSCRTSRAAGLWRAWGKTRHAPRPMESRGEWPCCGQRCGDGVFPGHLACCPHSADRSSC